MPVPSALLAEQFAAAQADLTELVTTATAHQLALITREEGWSVLFVAHHLAMAFTAHTHWVRHIIAGHDVMVTNAQLDADNAQMALEASRLTRASVLAEISTNGTQTTRFLRSLSPQQLATSAHVALAGGRQMTAEHLIRGIMLGHFAAHVPHMRAALAGSAISPQAAVMTLIQEPSAL